MQNTLSERFSTFESFWGFSYNEAAKEVYAMRKKMIAMLFVLILTLSGCADVSTAPEESDNYDIVKNGWHIFLKDSVGYAASFSDS